MVRFWRSALVCKVICPILRHSDTFLQPFSPGYRFAEQEVADVDAREPWPLRAQRVFVIRAI